jgi:hypothetical protein
MTFFLGQILTLSFLILSSAVSIAADCDNVKSNIEAIAEQARKANMSPADRSLEKLSELDSRTKQNYDEVVESIQLSTQLTKEDKIKYNQVLLAAKTDFDNQIEKMTDQLTGVFDERKFDKAIEDAEKQFTNEGKKISQDIENQSNSKIQSAPPSSPANVATLKPEVIQPGKTYTLPNSELSPAKMVTFSKEVQKYLIDAGDLGTEFLKALSKGTVAAKGQSGLKRFTGHRDVWEVKSKHTDYRLLGCIENGVLILKSVRQEKGRSTTLPPDFLRNLCK